MSMMANSTSLNVRIDGDVDPYEREVRRAEAATRSYERSLASLNRDLMALEKQLNDDVAKRLQKRNEAFTATGRGMVVAGGAMLVGAGFAVKAAMDWESAWRDVQKVVTGTPEQMGILEDQLRDIAKVMPASHQEIAATAAAAGQLGVAREDIASFTKTMIMMGTATNLSSDEAATSIARFMNVMRSAGADVDNIGSTIVALGNKGASTESEIVSMAQRVAGAGQLIGASQQDVLGLSAAMANLGIQSELGGGAMQRVLTIIYSKMKAGGDAVKGLADIAGVSADEFAANWEKDPVKALDLLLHGLGRVKDGGGDVIQTLAGMGISGTQNLQVMLRLAGAGDELTKSLATANSGWEKNNALTNEANQRYQTAASRMEIARNNLNDVAIEIGASLLPALVSMLDFISHLAQGFEQLPGPIKAIIGPATALLGAITLLGGALLLAIPRISAFNAAVASGAAGARLTAMGRGVQGLAGVLAGPWGLALAGGITALTLFAAHQGAAKAAIEELKQTLDEQTGAVTENTRAWAVKRLTDSGALKDAQILGLSLKLVTDAALGNKAALEQVAGATDKYADSSARVGTSGEMSGAAHALNGELGVTNGMLDEARAKWQLQHEAMGGAADAADKTAKSADNVSGAEKQLGQDTQATSRDMGLQSASAKKLMGALDKLNDVVLGQRAGARDYQETLEESRKTLQAGTRSLNIHTKAGRDNQAALDSIAESTLRWADAAGEADKTGQQSFAIMQQGRKDLIATARGFGFTADQANHLADEILKVPKKWETAFTVNTAGAQGQISAFVAGANASLANIQNQTVDIMLSRHRVGPALAGGGAVRGPGGPTDDRVLARISNGEHVWTAREVTAAGGHGAVESMRREVRQGRVRAVHSELGVVGRAGSGAAATAGRGSAGGPMRIAGTLTIPGFGEGYIRGVVQDEMGEEQSYEDALAGRGAR